MDFVSSLELRSITNGGGKLNNCGLVLDSLRLSNSGIDCGKVIVTVSDMDTVPAV